MFLDDQNDALTEKNVLPQLISGAILFLIPTVQFLYHSYQSPMHHRLSQAPLSTTPPTSHQRLKSNLYFLTHLIFHLLIFDLNDILLNCLL